MIGAETEKARPVIVLGEEDVGIFVKTIQSKGIVGFAQLRKNEDWSKVKPNKIFDRADCFIVFQNRKAVQDMEKVVDLLIKNWKEAEE